jgi:hypothetical protein
MGRIALWTGTVVLLVSSFHEPAATYDWALRPPGDPKNPFGVPWPVDEARKWTSITGLGALLLIALAAAIQARLLRSHVTPRRWFVATITGAAGALAIDMASVSSGGIPPESWRLRAGLCAGVAWLFGAQFVSLPAGTHRRVFAAIAASMVAALALPFVSIELLSGMAIICIAGGAACGATLMRRFPT